MSGVALHRQGARDRAAAAARAAEARAAEAERLADLLQGVVASSRELLEVGSLEAGLARWLSVLTTAAGADRAGLGIFECTTDGDADATDARAGAEQSMACAAGRMPGAIPRARTLVDATAPGVTSAGGVQVPLTTDFVEWTRRLLDGQPIWASRDDLVDPASRAYWDATQCACNLIVPVLVDGAAWGWLYFDYAEPRPYRAADAAVLRTAADGVAAAVRRERLLETSRLERARAAAERTRVLEAHNALLAQRAALLQTITDISQDLIRLPDPACAFDDVVARLGIASGTDRVRLVRITPTDALSARGRVTVLAEWDAPGVVRRMARSERTPGVDELGPAYDAWLAGRFVLPTRELPEPFRSAAAALGVRTQVAVPIRSAAGVPWGFLRFDDCTEEREWDVGLVAVLQVAGALLGSALERSEAELGRRLAEAERRRAEVAAAGLRAAAAESRTRLAQDLHDTIAQDFAAIRLHLASARSANAIGPAPALPPTLAAALHAADAAAQHGYAEARRTLAMLRAPDATDGTRHHPVRTSAPDARPPAARSARGAPAKPAGRRAGTRDGWPLAHDVRRTARARHARYPAPRPPLAIRVAGRPCDVPANVAAMLLRVVDAALANALQHAGASRLHVRLAGRRDHLLVTVRDDGCGFDPSRVATDRYGLVGMRERAAAAGARCDVTSVPGRGTVVTVQWPSSSSTTIAGRRSRARVDVAASSTAARQRACTTCSPATASSDGS